MSAPYEIVAAPYTLWVAPVGTVFPDVDTIPGASWFKIGSSGDKNYSDKGVTVEHVQKFGSFTPVGGTGKRKVWRQEEQLLISAELVDLSPDQYAKVLNDATVTDTPAGTANPGTSSFNLMQGSEVALFALLARGVSSVDDSMAADYQVPIVYQAESPKPTFSKGDAAMLAVQFEAIEDATYGFGKLIVQTALES
jgi:hypothetical protein